MSGSDFNPAMAPWAVAIVAACIGVITDIRSRRLPNWLTFPLIVSGLIYGTLGLPGSTGLSGALLGVVVAGAPFFILWLIGGGAAADAKMMMGLGAWVGPYGGMYLLLAVAIAGGVLAIAVALAGGHLRDSLMQVPHAAAVVPMVLLGPGKIQERQAIFAAATDTPSTNDGSRVRRRKLPYGIAIGAGTVISCIWIWLR